LILNHKSTPTPSGRGPTAAFIFFGAKKTKQKKHPQPQPPDDRVPSLRDLFILPSLRSPSRKMKNPLFGGFTWGPGWAVDKGLCFDFDSA
jgi:hypothetical protein